MVSEQEIERAVEAMAQRDHRAFWDRRLTLGEPGSAAAQVKRKEWDDIQESAREIRRTDARERLTAVLPILRPEGSTLIGGTCKDCRFRSGNGVFCDNEDSPTYDAAITPDFGCVHYQNR